MMRIDVVDDSRRRNPANGLTAQTQRRARQMRKTSLAPTMIVSAIAGTPTPTICLPLLLQTRWSAIRAKLLCPLHIDDVQT